MALALVAGNDGGGDDDEGVEDEEVEVAAFQE